MTFSAAGINWEGLARALQGEFTAYIGLLALALIALVYARKAGTASLAAAEAKAARQMATRVFLTVAILATAALGWRVATYASINRMPRADADKSGVYDQMKQNAAPKQ
jgi:hypothetical protein